WQEEGLVMKAILLATGLALASLAGTASAATVVYTMDSTSQDGFNLDFRSVNGNCPVDDPCAMINENQSNVLTFDGGSFDLLGVSFSFLGNAAALNTFRVEAFQGATRVYNRVFKVADYVMNTANHMEFSALGVDSVRFMHSGGGNVRYENV